MAHIIITIEKNEDGTLNLQAYSDADLSIEHNLCVTAIGMMEAAKMSMLAGRWGVLDKDKKMQQTMQGYKEPATPAKAKRR